MPLLRLDGSPEKKSMLCINGAKGACLSAHPRMIKLFDAVKPNMDSFVTRVSSRKEQQCNDGETSFILPQHQTDDAFSLNEKYPEKYLLLPGYFYINCLYFIRDDCNSEPRL